MYIYDAIIICRTKQRSKLVRRNEKASDEELSAMKLIESMYNLIVAINCVLCSYRGIEQSFHGCVVVE